jgi:hypothetical protein
MKMSGIKREKKGNTSDRGRSPSVDKKVSFAEGTNIKKKNKSKANWKSDQEKTREAFIN